MSESVVSAEQASRALLVLQGAEDSKEPWYHKVEAYEALKLRGKHLCELMRGYVKELREGPDDVYVGIQDIFALVNIFDVGLTDEPADYDPEKEMLLDWDDGMQVRVELKHFADTDEEFKQYMRDQLIANLTRKAQQYERKALYWKELQLNVGRKLEALHHCGDDAVSDAKREEIKRACF